MGTIAIIVVIAVIGFVVFKLVTKKKTQKPVPPSSTTIKPTGGSTSNTPSKSDYYSNKRG